MEDTISRQAAIDIWCYPCSRHMLGHKCTECGAVQEMMALPSVQPKAKWIPCSERMPDKSGEYLITIKWEDGSEIYFSWFYLRDRCWSYRNANVIAWMELPEPYREDKG